MPATTRAVILARGLGSRMRRADGEATLDPRQAQAADRGVKGMIPIGRPFMDYLLSALADAGVTDVCLVIGPEHDEVRRYYTTGVTPPPRRLRITFAIQALPRGTADAVHAAEAFAGDSHVLVLNSDNYYPPGALHALASLGASGLIGFDRHALVRDGNIPAERVMQFALAEPDDDGMLRDIIEKPDAATDARLAGHALVSMNLWSFSPVIFAACRRVAPSPRGELELQDAVRIAMHDLGESFQVIPYTGAVLDLSHRRDVAAVAAHLAGVAVTL